MGPRLGGRGMVSKAAAIAQASMLQWGRGSGAAEWRVRRHNLNALTLLQWGRGSGAAEWTTGYSLVLTREQASMGPRLGGRGMSGPWLDLATTHALQWGRGSGAAE